MDEKIKKCPNCCQLYQLKSATQKENIPLFLPCGHSMCETCIHNIVKFEEPIECKICQRSTELKPGDVAMLALNKGKLYEMFPINMFMFGELVCQRKESETHKKKDDSCFVNLKTLLESMDTGLCIECHNRTTKMCQQCSNILCDTCFNKSHKNFVVFQNHELETIKPKIQLNSCRTHKGKPLQYYCQTCTKPICMDCLVVGGDKSCKNHDVVSTEEMNDSFLEKLNDVSPKVDETFRRLTKTAVDIGHLLNNMENETGSSSELTQVLADVEQHFSKLFYTIQKHKTEVVDIIVKLKCSEKESLIKAKDEITNSIIRAKTTIDMFHMLLNSKKGKQINLAVLLQEAELVAESPFVLNKDETNDPLKVAVNEDVCGLLSDYIRLEGNANAVYQLRSVKDLPEGVEVPPPPSALVFPPELPKDVRQVNQTKVEKDYAKSPAPMFFKDAPKYRSKSGSVSSLNSADSDTSHRGAIPPYGNYGDGYQRPTVQQVQPFAESQHNNRQLHEGSLELIYISHIVDPHNFFVQRSCHQGMVKEMLREFRNASSLPKPSVNHVAEGKTYLVFNKADNMWQRCRVLSIDRRASNPVFQVFCIDFGSMEVVGIEKLRLLPPARVQTPYPLAIHCSLANCKPKTGSWSSDDSYLIQKIIDNKQAILHVRHIRATSNYAMTLDCDVTTFEDGVGLAQALVFHERATMPNPRLQYPKTMHVSERPKLFINNNDYKPKTTEEVHITNIVSPDKFYVRKSHLQSVYEKLCEDMEQEYSLGVNTGSVYLPEVDMVCVVNLEKYPEVAAGCGWARAKVLELPGRGRARLLLPDTGAQLLAHWAALRRVHPKHCTLAALATECHLAGVTPVNKKWSPASVRLLQLYQSRALRLLVEEQRRGALGVSLYHTEADEDVCINTEMIKHKFAVTFGIFMFNKNPVVEDQVITNKSPLDVPKPVEPKLDKIKILKKQPEQRPAKKEDQELDAKDKGPLRLEAKLLHYQSPSLFYVSLVHQQKVFNKLYEDMQKHYSKKKSQGKKDWAVGDRCCTVCEQSQTWRRAVILELEGEKAKVFYTDFACVETVPYMLLMELTPEFASTGNAAIKCHVCGVAPAGGEHWPTLTKEYLKELLDAYNRIFITKLGNFKDKSMPVELWVYHTIQGGALEPNTSEWRCLNKKIIEQGLGVPDKTQQIPGSECSDVVEDDMLSFLKNVTGSVHEYLQLEPMPTKPLVVRSEESSGRSSPEFQDANMDATPGCSNTVFITDWLPAEPLPCKEFTGMPTYIDNDGVIFLHDVTQHDTLELIGKALDARFAAPDPKARYARWTVGEPCVALFFLDNRFYRGRVVEVQQDNAACLVHYIDYGNEELCSFENLRKTIALYQIPIQAHKCILSRIRPATGQWERHTLDYLHKTVVEKKCFVKVVGEPIQGVSAVELKYDKLWINDHLVEFEMGVYTDGSKAVQRKFASKKTKDEPAVLDIDSGPDYIVDDENNTSSDVSFNIQSLEGKDWNQLIDEEQGSLIGRYIAYPKNDLNEFECNITIINDLRKIPLTIVHDDETSALYEAIFGDLQREAENMSPLNGIFEHKACISLFHEDEQWYRAVIMQYNESDHRVKVNFVDFGNVEVVSLADLRETREEWARLPPATVTVLLHGVTPNPKLDPKTIAQHYADTLIDNGPFHAKVITYIDSLPSVELRNGDGEIVYQNMIQDEVLLKDDTEISD